MAKRRYLTTKYEQSLWEQGKCAIAGIDEAGRGALAGPIVAAAVVFPSGIELDGIHDSKLLSARNREQRYEEICAAALAWSVGIVPQSVIDAKGISFANAEVFRRALRRLKTQPDYIFSDAFPVRFNGIPCEAVIDGDAKVFTIAAASILAKVYRDRLMREAHVSWPDYGFAQHKGYGTELHRLAIRRHGITPFHRASFIHIE